MPVFLLRRNYVRNTEISPQVKDKNRCNIYVDGSFYCGMKLETAVKSRLKVGQHVEKAFLDEIQLENEKSEAMDRALNFLSASMKTGRQVTDYLKKKGYVPAVCEYVRERLEGYGYVDDAEYCRAYLASASKTKGRRLLEAELKSGARKRSASRRRSPRWKGVRIPRSQSFPST